MLLFLSLIFELIQEFYAVYEYFENLKNLILNFLKKRNLHPRRPMIPLND